jgi:hypothetical protein
MQKSGKINNLVALSLRNGIHSKKSIALFDRVKKGRSALTV